MPIKHMKRYSTSYVTREMKIKTKRYHQTTTQGDTTTHLLEWPKTEQKTNAGENVEQWELSHISGESAKWYNHFGRLFGGFL